MDRERERFEAWCETGAPEINDLRKNDDGSYLMSDIQRDWLVWQAAIASRQQQEADAHPSLASAEQAAEPSEEFLVEMAAELEREIVRKTIQEVTAKVEAAAWSEPFKSGLLSGIEEVSACIKAYWEQLPPISAANYSLASADTERFEWFFGEADKVPFLPKYIEGMSKNYTVDQWRSAIDTAIAASTTGSKG